MNHEAQQHMQRVLDALGLAGDPEMADTAARFTEFLAGLESDPTHPELSRCAASIPGQLVALCDVPFHSLCAHHLLPFSGTVDLAYRAGDQLAGFGAIPRLVRWAARRPQLQERLAQQIVEVLVAGLQPRGVLVRIEAHHACVEMRGSETPARIVVEASAGDLEGLRPLIA